MFVFSRPALAALALSALFMIVVHGIVATLGFRAPAVSVFQPFLFHLIACVFFYFHLYYLLFLFYFLFTFYFYCLLLRCTVCRFGNLSSFLICWTVHDALHAHYVLYACLLLATGLLLRELKWSVPTLYLRLLRNHIYPESM